MSFNSQYYTNKQINLQQKLVKIKDQYITDYLNMAQRLANEIQEIQKEYNEITGIIQEGETKEKEVKKETKPIIKKGK